MIVITPKSATAGPRAVRLAEKLAAAVRSQREVEPQLARADLDAAFELAHAEMVRELGGSSGVQRILGITLATVCVFGWLTWYFLVGRTAGQPLFVSVTTAAALVVLFSFWLCWKGR